MPAFTAERLDHMARQGTIEIDFLWNPLEPAHQQRTGEIATASVWLNAQVSVEVVIDLLSRGTDCSLRLHWPRGLQWKPGGLNLWTKKIRLAFEQKVQSERNRRDRAWQNRRSSFNEEAERLYRDFFYKRTPGAARSSTPTLPWTAIGLSGPTDQRTAKLAYYQASRRAHPDHGGTHEQQVKVNNAWQAICNAMGWN